MAVSEGRGEEERKDRERKGGKEMSVKRKEEKEREANLTKSKKEPPGKWLLSFLVPAYLLCDFGAVTGISGP